MTDERSKKSSTRRPPRASFVVTFSVAAAALVGCGGQVGQDAADAEITDQSHNPPFDGGSPDTADVIDTHVPDVIISNPPDVRPETRDDVGEDVATSCPKTPPKVGDACSGITYCDYSTCGPTGGSGNASSSRRR